MKLGLIIAVVADPSAIITRSDRSRYTETDIRRRIASQLPQAEKAGRADFTIRNDGDLENARRNTLFVLSLAEAIGRTRVPA